LLQDEARLRHERRTRAHMRDRMIRGASMAEGEEPEDENSSRRLGNGGSRRNKDDDDLRRAIEESKKSLAQERLTAEERDLQEAIKLSQEEESKRNKAVEDSNASALFDDSNQLCVVLFHPLTGYTHVVCSPPAQSNNPFPTMSMMSDPTPYTVGLQPQFTAMQPQFTSIQPQFTSFNPYQQQMQQQQEAAQVIGFYFNRLPFLDLKCNRRSICVSRNFSSSSSSNSFSKKNGCDNK
jgi:epsin